MGESNPPNNKVTLVSFGFKYGAPDSCAMVFDVRMLRNPFWIDELRQYNGHDPRIREYIFADPNAAPISEKIGSLIAHSVPLYRPEPGRNTIIGIGCTGGRHRSVAMVNEVAQKLEGNGFNVKTVHRDIDKDTVESADEEP